MATALCAAPVFGAVSINVLAGNVTNPNVSKRTMGCHHDYGFANAVAGFNANLAYASSFENGALAVPAWTPRQSAGANANIGIARGTAFSTKPSMGVSMPNTAPPAAYGAVVNRGPGGVGIVFEAGKPYSIEVFVWANKDSGVFAELRDFAADASLARVDWTATASGPAWGSTWIRYNFTLTPVAGTTCVSIPFGSDPTIDCGSNAGPAYVCVRCDAHSPLLR